MPPPKRGSAPDDPLSTPSRRRFLALAGATGASLVAGCTPKPTGPTGTGGMPLRRLGKTGMDIPILMFGCVDLLPTSRILLRQAFGRGVTAWETAEEYGKGNSETAIGMYLEAFPQDRASLFLMTKSTAPDHAGLSAALDRSLARMRTDHVELFLLHGIPGPEVLTDEMRRFGDDARASGKVKAFGFAAHKRVLPSLQAAAKLDWIDAVLVACSYRSLLDEAFSAALDACHAADIGVVAMKTQGLPSLPVDPQAESALAERFADRGLTLPQARLQAVWDHPAVASICSKMPNTRELGENIAAALDARNLRPADRKALQDHAGASRSSWCDGCGRCEDASGLPVPEVLRSLMYARMYGETEKGRALYARVMDGRDVGADQLRAAEAACPSGVPVAQALADARGRFA